MFCKYCGKELSDGSAFCKYCGKAQTSASSAPAQPTAETPVQNSTEDTVQSTIQNVVQKVGQSAAAGASVAQKAAQKAAQSAAVSAVQDAAQNAVHSVMKKAGQPISKELFLRRLKATCKMLSLAGWVSLLAGALSAVLALFVLLDIILMLNLSGLPVLLILVLFALWFYIFGVHQFWYAAAIEEGLNITLPDGKGDAAWLAFIRENFVLDGAQLSESQPENAVVYLMDGAQMWLTAENGVLHISVKHQKRFNSARSGGHWELQESFHADNLKCALDYFLKEEPLPDSFVQDQKAVHKDKVGKVKKGLVAVTAVIVLILLLISMLPTSPIDSLKDSSWDQYNSTGMTMGEAFGRHFKDVSWDSYKADGRQYIRFTGSFDLEDYGENSAEILFSVDKAGDQYHFVIRESYINGIALSDYEEAALMQYGFNGNSDDLVSAFFVSWLFG